MSELTGAPPVPRPALYRIMALLAALTVAGVLLGVWAFPRAFPSIALQQRVTRQIVLQRADSFFAANGIAPQRARTAVTFRTDNQLITFVDLAGGGDDTLNALVRGRDVTPFDWSVRAFVPGDVHEASVAIAPDGRIIGFSRTLAEADSRPTITPDSGERLARHVLTAWLGEAPSRWTLVTTSYQTQKTSRRIDRTYTFERVGRRVAGAPIRLPIEIDGDAPAGASSDVEIPDTFVRRYSEMRSANEALSLGATVALLVMVLAGALIFRRFVGTRGIRWRGPMVVGAAIGVLLFAAGLNDVPGRWYDYDTATSPTIFAIMGVLDAIVAGAAMGAVVAFTLAAAEAAERRAFPEHPAWWALWTNRGTREIAGRVAAGYAVAAVDFAYVALFYIVTRRLLGWWVPSELLDDPNQIATPMPWVTGIANSLQAGVWEESLFRALPLSLLALWVGTRPRRRWWMAAGVVVTALIFGFAHANYASWPPYSRGAEIFLDACLWAVIFLRFGILVTVIAHFSYDLVLFGLFTASGNGASYRVAGAVMLAALFAPAAAVAWRWVRQRGLVNLTNAGRMGGWEAAQATRPPPQPQAAPLAPVATALTTRERVVAFGTVAIAALGALIAPNPPVLGSPFTATRTRVESVADSVLRARGVATDGWRTFAIAASNPYAEWHRFLRAHAATGLADSLDRSYAVPAWWTVRYVHVKGLTAARAEEWRVRLFPDGALFDVHHIVPDSARGDSLSDADARRQARSAMVGAGLDTTHFVEAELHETPRPARRDVDVTFTDTTVKLPADAAARAWVSLAGADPVLVRRGVELPEAFEREDTKRQDTLSAIQSVSGLALGLMLLLAAIVAIRRRPAILAAEPSARRPMTWFLIAVACLQIASAVNALPITLFNYDTATPWSTFLSTTAVAIALSPTSALAVLGLILLADALRRRAGIPLVPDAHHVADAQLAGAALGAVLTLPLLALGFARHVSIPPAPQTLLDHRLPWLTPLLSLPVSTALSLLGTAIFVLLIAVLARKQASRVALAVLLLAPTLGLVVATLDQASTVSVVRIAGGVAIVAVEFALVYAAFRAWGAIAAWSWVIAALMERLLIYVHGALHEATPDGRIAALLTAIAVGAGLALTLRWRPTSAVTAASPFVERAE